MLMVNHILLMIIYNLLMLKNFWEILPLLNYFLKCLWLWFLRFFAMVQVN